MDVKSRGRLYCRDRVVSLCLLWTWVQKSTSVRPKSLTQLVDAESFILWLPLGVVKKISGKPPIDVVQRSAVSLRTKSVLVVWTRWGKEGTNGALICSFCSDYILINRNWLRKLGNSVLISTAWLLSYSWQKHVKTWHNRFGPTSGAMYLITRVKGLECVQPVNVWALLCRLVRFDCRWI
jgi:hypothetical protein